MLRLQRILLGLCCGLLLSAGAPGLLFAASASRTLEAKVSLEASLERRLQAILQKVLGTENVVVIVNVDLYSQKTSPGDIMPGVPIKDMPGPDRSITRTMVKRLSAIILVDEGTKESDIELLKRTSTKILGIDAKRGDKLEVEQIKLRGTGGLLGPAGVSAGGGSLWSARNLISLAWLGSALLALLLLYGSFLRPLLAVVRKIALTQGTIQPAAAPTGRAALPAELETPQVVQAAAATPHTSARGEPNAPWREALPFGFITPRHMPMLNFLARRMTPRTTAVIAHYIPAAQSAQLLISLKVEKRKHVVAFMARVTQLQEAEVHAIEANVKNKIEFLMGGEDKLAEIIEEVPAQMQEEILNTLKEKDPAVGQRLSKRVVLLEDIAMLEAADLKALSRRVQLQSLAAVLKDSDTIRRELLPKLTSGLGQWLAQEIELSKKLPPDSLAKEQHKVLSALSQLVREGTITLKKGAPEPASEESREFEPSPGSPASPEEPELSPPEPLPSAAPPPPETAKPTGPASRRAKPPAPPSA